MSTAVVVYESMFGNTHVVADRIAEGLAPLGEVKVVPVGEADAALLSSADLLVVGGPTHVHGMSRPTTRAGAVAHPENYGEDVEVDPDAEGPGLREWFDELGALDGVAAAAFDTRAGGMSPMLSGRASKGIHKRLHRHGMRTIADPESFEVNKETHLLEGEEDRARAWGADLAAAVAAG